MTVAHVEPAEWLPQTGAMVLIDEVVQRDPTRIACRATSHQRADHPLAYRGRLPVWAGIEYAAQAIALHRALGTAHGERPRIGLLGALRDVACSVGRLDDVPGVLIVEATQLFADGNGAVYGFVVRTEECVAPLITGRATVIQP